MPGPSLNERPHLRDKSRPRLQRILRSQPNGVVGSSDPSPVRPSISQVEAEGFEVAAPVGTEVDVVGDGNDIQYQCTSCDMMVSPSDAYCPFCGAIFSDGPLASEEASEPEEEPATVEAEDVRKPPRGERARQPERFDVLSLLRPHPKSRDLLYNEALKGFVGSARLLEDIELMISEVSSLGNDTTRARRMMSDAWEACREGDWPLVSALARQTEAMMTPNIPDLVRRELASARNMIMQAKTEGVDTSRYLVTAKSAMHALHGNNLDEALRLTKELMDALREDALQRDGFRGRR